MASRLNGASDRLIGIGASGTEFARRIRRDAPSVTVKTRCFSREREKRQLEAEACRLDYEPVLLDDLAVSGLTLAVARRATEPIASTVAIGMLFNSQTTRRRIGVDDIISGVTYCRLGGGNPPINSIKTLREIPERLDDLVSRYFNGSADFKQVIKGEK